MMIRKRAVIFISGGGSNMEMLIQASLRRDYPVEIIAVISDRADAQGLFKAEALGIASFVFNRDSYSSKGEHEGAILKLLAGLMPDIICLAGYMRLLSPAFIAHYPGRILNIHPSLLPLFTGLDTHQRALDAGMKLAGCTVHIVTETMDGGSILAQAAVPILDIDTAQAVAMRVLAAEHRLFGACLAKFASGIDNATDPAAIIVSLG